MPNNRIDMIWEQLLSRNPDLIRAMYAELMTNEKKAVIQHLQKMVSEEGWHVEQVKSAKMALKAIKRKRPIESK